MATANTLERGQLEAGSVARVWLGQGGDLFTSPRGVPLEWWLIFASVTVSALPVVAACLLLSRQVIAGLTAGSVKG